MPLASGCERLLRQKALLKNETSQSGNHNQVFACIEQPRVISSRFCRISAEYMGRAKVFLKTLTSVVIIMYRLRAREKQRLWGKRSILFRHFVCIRTQRSSSSSCSACSTHSSSLSSILPSALFLSILLVSFFCFTAATSLPSIS